VDGGVVGATGGGAGGPAGTRLATVFTPLAGATGTRALPREAGAGALPRAAPCWMGCLGVADVVVLAVAGWAGVAWAIAAVIPPVPTMAPNANPFDTNDKRRNARSRY
jgi:hypothetical protein